MKQNQPFFSSIIPYITLISWSKVEIRKLQRNRPQLKDVRKERKKKKEQRNDDGYYFLLLFWSSSDETKEENEQKQKTTP